MKAFVYWNYDLFRVFLLFLLEGRRMNIVIWKICSVDTPADDNDDDDDINVKL